MRGSAVDPRSMCAFRLFFHWSVVVCALEADNRRRGQLLQAVWRSPPAVGRRARHSDPYRHFNISLLIHSATCATLMLSRKNVLAGCDHLV